MVPRLLIFALVLGALVAALLHSQRRSGPLVVSGFVEADEIRVGSRVGGRVAAVHVEEGRAVAAGEVLVELEPFELDEQRAALDALLASRRAEHARLAAGLRPAELDMARARRDGLGARLAELEAGPRPQAIAASRSGVALAEAQLALAKQEFDRAQRLTAENVTSVETLDRATSRLHVEEASLEVARAELALLEEGTRAEEIAQARAELAGAQAALALAEEGYRTEDVERAAALVAAAEADARALERRVAELAVRAPTAGVIEALDRRPGDLVAPDAPVLSMLDPTRLWVRAYVPENRLDIELGRAVDVTVDSYPEQRFRGRVTFVARHAEFTPGNVQTPEERSKQVFRIEVELDEGHARLRPGMAADVHVEARE